MAWDIEDISNEDLTEDLTEDDIPWENEGWDQIQQFAISFNGYDHWRSFENCADIANESVGIWRKAGTVPASLTELRTCLFFEQRRWRHFGYEPDADTLEYVKMLVRAIHDIVARREQGEPVLDSSA